MKERGQEGRLQKSLRLQCSSDKVLVRPGVEIIHQGSPMVSRNSPALVSPWCPVTNWERSRETLPSAP